MIFLLFITITIIDRINFLPCPILAPTFAILAPIIMIAEGLQ